MKFTNTEVWGFEHAIRGARNPMNSWDKSDSGWLRYCTCLNPGEEISICSLSKDIRYGCNYDACDGGSEPEYKIGPSDMDLLQRLIKAGPEHRKFMRQIMVSVDITAPLYFYKEFDTYKIGTTANSTSTMHKLTSAPITKECFEMDDYEGSLLMYECEPYDLDAFTDDIWDNIINYCETLRKSYLETKDKRYWKELIRILPESWLQTRTVTMNYENLYSIVRQRSGHKLTEWKSFIDWVHTLPFANELIFLDK